MQDWTLYDMGGMLQLLFNYMIAFNSSRERMGMYASFGML